MPGQLVIVEGLIGAGKSTLTTHLQELFPEASSYQEPDEVADRNPYLQDFYLDMPRWALTMQLHLLTTRAAMQREGQQQALSFCDRSVYGDACFARMLLKEGILTQREFRTYQQAHKELCLGLQKPDLCILLDVHPHKALHRIQKRYQDRPGRQKESAITLPYLQALQEELEVMATHLKELGVPVMRFDYNNDFQMSEIDQKVRGFLCPR
jgi:deoxyadenosine/deoxycytidine kinase